MRLRLLMLLLSLPLSAYVSVSGQTADKAAGSKAETAERIEEPSRRKDTLWIVPHTHWEGAVFKTREEYLEMGLPNILRALSILKNHPNYRFALDQVCYVKPFLERYPEEEAAFRKLIAEGRLQIVGGVDTMHDNNMPSGESIVRQMLYGKGYYRDKLGVDVTVGWALDTFGHNAQMPQLLKLAGYKSYWFRRGVPTMDLPAEFLWQGIDGTQIAAFWLPYGYGLFYGSPKNLFEFTGFVKERFALLTRFIRGPDRVGLAGADVSDPEEHLPVMVDEFNRAADAPFSIRFAVPTEFEAAVSKHAEWPVVKGEFNPVFQGIYSSRIEVKQWMRELERILTTWEKLDVLANWLGVPIDQESLTRAWEPVLFNQAHDLASGVMVDKVYDDTMRGYQFSKRLADEMVEARLESIFSKIDTSGDGIPIVVLNTLGWPRTDIAEVDIGFSDSGVAEIGLTDPSDKAIPVQILEAQRYHNGGLKRARIAFVARDVPALGYSVFHVIPKPVRPSVGEIKAATTGLPQYSASHQDTSSIENDFYRVTFNLWTGEMKSLIVKASNWEVLSGPANVVALEQDGGDFWELYGILNGGRTLAMSGKHGVPGSDRAQFSNQWVGGNGSTRTGPVISEYRVTHPFGNGNFATTVRLYNGIRRIDINTQILNNDKFVRYRVLFPTSIKNGKNVHEIPFGAIERPLAIEFPAQNWIDYSDGTKGLALLNRGLPGNNVADGTMMLSLMRSARITAYAFHGGYEPGVSSDSGLELGKQLTFHYALVPHPGDWREAGIYRAGLEFNNPLIVRKVARHVGPLPKRWGLMEVSHKNVVTSALKTSRDGSAILRVYEASGHQTTGVKIKMEATIASAYEANLMEDVGRMLEVQNSTLQFDLGPYEIKTFKLKLRPLKSHR